MVLFRRTTARLYRSYGYFMRGWGIGSVLLINSTHFDKEPGDVIIDEAGGDFFPAFGFERMLVAVELIAMTAHIMFTDGVEDKAVVLRAGLVFHYDISVVRLPDEVYELTCKYASFSIYIQSLR